MTSLEKYLQIQYICGKNGSKLLYTHACAPPHTHTHTCEESKLSWEKNKAEGIRLPDFKLYDKAILIISMILSYTYRYTDGECKPMHLNLSLAEVTTLPGFSFT